MSSARDDGDDVFMTSLSTLDAPTRPAATSDERASEEPNGQATSADDESASTANCSHAICIENLERAMTSYARASESCSRAEDELRQRTMTRRREDVKGLLRDEAERVERLCDANTRFFLPSSKTSMGVDAHVVFRGVTSRRVEDLSFGAAVDGAVERARVAYRRKRSLLKATAISLEDVDASLEETNRVLDVLGEVDTDGDEDENAASLRHVDRALRECRTR